MCVCVAWGRELWTRGLVWPEAHVLGCGAWKNTWRNLREALRAWGALEEFLRVRE